MEWGEQKFDARLEYFKLILIKLRVISYFIFIHIRVELGHRNFYNLEHLKKKKLYMKSDW